MIARDLRKKYPQGVTLLLVMLILSLVSSIALAITFLILRQFEQGGDVKAATRAYFAADSGVERLLYEAKLHRTAKTPAAFVADATTAYGCDGAEQQIDQGATFCVDEQQAFESQTQVSTRLEENQVSTVDLYNPEYDPSDALTFTNIDAIKLSGQADGATWIEVSWIAWQADANGYKIVSAPTKAFFSGSELATERTIHFKRQENVGGLDILFLNAPSLQDTNADNEPEFFPGNLGQCVESGVNVDGCLTVPTGSPLNYIVRVKALYGGAPEVTLKAYSNCVLGNVCSDTDIVEIPSRVQLKVNGNVSDVQQSVRVSMPWNLALAGLYDYAILATDSLIKDTQINPGFFSTGTIEAEKGLDIASDYLTTAWASASVAPTLGPFECLGANLCGGVGSNWDYYRNVTADTDLTSTDSRCLREPGIGASGDATCGFTSANGSIVYDIEDALAQDPNDNTTYYLNYRVRFSALSQEEKFAISVCDEGVSGNCTWATSTHRIDETQSGLPGTWFKMAPYKDKDGWLVCSSGLLTTDTFRKVKFMAGDADVVDNARLDWFNFSTVPYVNPAKGCEFTTWGASGEYEFEVEDGLAAAQCGQPQAGYGYPTLCNPINTWFGYHRIGFLFANEAAPNGQLVSCNDANMPNGCFLRLNAGLVGDSLGMTLNFKNSATGFSEEITEGYYHVLLNYGSIYIKDEQLPIDAADDPDEIHFHVGSYREQLPAEINGDNYHTPSYQTNVLAPVQPGEFIMYGPKDLPAASLCVLPGKYRVKSGDSFKVSIFRRSNDAAVSKTRIGLDSVELSADYPTDGSGNPIPTCSP